MPVLAVLFFFFLLLEIVEPQRKKKKRKKRKAEQGTEAGELCDTTFHLSPYIITECEFLCSVKIAECQWRSYRTFLSTSE